LQTIRLESRKLHHQHHQTGHARDSEVLERAGLDADCNAANAAAVVGALHGMRCLPNNLVDQLGDRIVGDKMGAVALTPPVNVRISDLAKRTVAIGEKIIAANGGRIAGEKISIPVQQPTTQPAELFKLADLMQYWNSDWTLERAGFGGAGGGMAGIRGITHLGSGRARNLSPRRSARRGIAPGGEVE